MSSAPKTRQLLIDKCRSKYSWAAGVTRGTPSAIEWHQKDLETAFAEINGLMAGLRFQDEAESCTVEAASPSSLSQSPLGSATPVSLFNTPQYPTKILDESVEHLREATVEHHAATCGKPIPDAEHQPMASQWAAIRSLREETAFHHERFQQLCQHLGDSTVSKLLETYPNAESVRNKGAQLVKDVLEGFRPRELSLVFAFASFAYAISQLLYKNGRIDRSEILADLSAWRNLISDPRERQTFDLIAQKLWPEAKDHLHFIPVATRAKDAQCSDHLSNPVRQAGSAIPDFSSFSTHGHDTGDHSSGLYPTEHFGFGNATSCSGREDAVGLDIVRDHTDYLMNVWDSREEKHLSQYSSKTVENTII
jgi:hypothetical protein